MLGLDAPLLLDRYRPVRLLARGGHSSVYRAHDELLGRDVAIKILGGADPAIIAQFDAERRDLAGLSHHGVVAILDAGIDDSMPADPRPFLVMELVRGTSVRDLIREREISLRTIGEIAFELAEALDYVHSRGVIHRDITPANVMLVDYGTPLSRPRARLTDFGIAIDEAWDASVDGNLVRGTVAYLSPEQVRHERLAPASDIYSLGLVLLECFTRETAFPGDPMTSALARIRSGPLIPDMLPKVWRLLLADMTASDPSDRPPAEDVAVRARDALGKMRRPKARGSARTVHAGAPRPAHPAHRDPVAHEGDAR